MGILETKTGIVLYDPNKVRMGVDAHEILNAYTKSEMIQSLISTDSWYGTIQNPLDMFKIETYVIIDPKRIAFRIKRIWKTKSKIFGDIDILDNPSGQMMSKLFNVMVFVPRALGHKEQNKTLLITFDVRPDMSKAEVEVEDGVQE
jgi:hypothetical protein